MMGLKLKVLTSKAEPQILAMVDLNLEEDWQKTKGLKEP
jgi:hypothetical protein